MKKLILLVGMIFGPLGHAAATDIEGKIYDLGHTDGAPLYLQKIHFEDSPGGERKASGTIADDQGKVWLTETATLQGGHIVSQRIDQFQIGESYELKVEGDRATFQTYKLAETGRGEKKSEKSQKIGDDFVTGPGTMFYLMSHWEELKSGKKVEAQFGVFEFEKTIGFNLRKIGEGTTEGHATTKIEMKISNFLLRMLVDPIEFDVDDQGFMFHFKGRTPVQKKVGEKWKPLDAEINYRKVATKP